jgi:hypothetical protein
MDGHVVRFEKIHKTLNVLAKNLSAYVVGVVMSGHHADQPKPFIVKPSKQARHIVRRVDQQYLSRGDVADHIDVIAHRDRELVAHRKVSARRQLAKVQAVLHSSILTALHG